MEKIYFKNTHGVLLAGYLWKNNSKTVIILAHGSSSNKKARGFFEALAPLLQAQGHSILTFDFAGHGESEDTVFTLEKSVDDVHAAVDFCTKAGYETILLFGHSSGAYGCLKAFTPKIKTMILVGALSGPVDWKLEDKCTSEHLKEAKHTGQITLKVNDGYRDTLKISGKIFDEIAKIDQQKLFAPVTCPILFIHGDSDQDELDLQKYSQQALKLLPPSCQLTIIPGASHLFTESVPAVNLLTAEWLMKHLPIVDKD